MGTEKRDALAGQAALFVPLARDALGTAERCVDEGKLPEARVAIREAQAMLGGLTPLFEAACIEANGEAE